MTLQSYTWNEIWRAGAQTAQKLSKFCGPHTRRLHIPPLEMREGLILLCAALQLSLDPIFDEKNAYDLVSDPGVIRIPADLWPSETGHQESSAGFALTPHSPSMKACIETLKDRTFIFCTSGSTGHVKSFPKSAAGLLAEVEQLADLFSLGEGSQLVSLVRPFHIYGFLHSFLLPLTTLSSVTYWSTQKALPTKEHGFPQELDLLILVPAQWRLVTLLWETATVRQLVTSGAPFGPARALELKELAKTYQTFLEILGSTETGGIGYRPADSDEQRFRFFKGITITADEKGTHIHSPFLIPELSTLTADRLESVDANHFEHRGRTDRIFKYGGVRHSLEEVEETLRAALGEKALVSYFRDDPKIAQGGVLYTWVEGLALSPSEILRIRAHYQEKTTAPFPQKLIFVDEIPRDQQGKIRLVQLLPLAPLPNAFGK